MARTDHDSWDITESVGATALGVAAARAAEAASDDPLVVDPYARVFIDAVDEGMWTMFADGTIPDELVEADPDLPGRMRAMIDYTASRTVFFDQFFLNAADAGVRQAVILASGLDARGWRLPWPDGVTVFELDQPKVLEFKASTLKADGAKPSASNLVEVPIDLRDEWPTALCGAGFDVNAPTAWSAEGLLPFLPAQAQDLMFERIQALSAAGSRVAVEAMGSDFVNPERIERRREQMQRYRAAAAKMGRTDIPDVMDLWYFEDRADVGDWLRARGWEVEVVTAQQLMASHQRSAPKNLEDEMPNSLFISARRP
jgi:methyltransferase (TIGR00027 family)